jgi:Flp pilus assembly protein TadG
MKFRACLEHVLRVIAPRENEGVAAVEFAILSTIFLTLLAGTIDIGLMLYNDFQLDSAVDAGAQYALNNTAMVGSNPSNLSNDISSIVNNLMGCASCTTVSVNNNDGTHCYCPSGTPGNWSWGSASTSCGSNCPSGSGVYGQFVTITAQGSLSPIFPSFGFVPGTISRSVLVETQ